MRTKLLLALLFLGAHAVASAQGVKLGDNPDVLHPASLLELESRSLVFVPTRMNNGQMNAITPLDGALIYNTVEEGLYFYDNSTWSAVGNVREVADNIFAGDLSGDANSGLRNAAYGFRAMQFNATGNNNTAMGRFSLRNNLNASNNSAFGYNALAASNAALNSAFGAFALEANSTGANNSAFGVSALRSHVSGTNNSAFGLNALRGNISGNNNSAFGVGALQLALGSTNSAFGRFALQALTGGNGNVAMGFNAGRLIENGQGLNDVANSVFIGNGAGSQANGQNNQIVIGAGAIGNGANTVTIGNDAITDNYFNGNMDITGEFRVNGSPISGGGGGFDPNFGTNNVFVGNGAGENTAEDATGRENVAMGVAALGSNVTGIRNTAIGTEALFSNVSSEGNTAVGNSALIKTTAPNNTGIGYLALSGNTTGQRNSAIGNAALGELITGGDNTGLGSRAGLYLADGSTFLTNANFSLYIGSNTRANANGQVHQTVIGHGVTGNGSNTTTIGYPGNTDNYFTGKVHANGFKLKSLQTAPASSSAPGETGEIRIDANFIYVCVAPNSWVRAALDTW